MIYYILVAWISFSLGIVFSQTKTGKKIVNQINYMLDQAGIKSKKEEKEKEE